MRIIKSLKYAMAGIYNCFCSERNFRIQIFVTLLTMSSGSFFRITVHEWIAVLACTALVLSLEMINTSVEKLADHVCSSVHPDIKVVKDLAAGAVLISSVISFITGLIIFLPKIKIMFFP